MTDRESSRILNVIALGLLICAIVFHKEVLLYLAAVVLALTTFPNRAARFMAAGWMRLGGFLGGINSRILLAIAYYLVLVPFAFCYRRFNRGMVAYFAGKDRESFFIDATRRYDREMFDKIW